MIGALWLCVPVVGAESAGHMCPAIELARTPLVGAGALAAIDARSRSALAELPDSDPLVPYAHYLLAEIAHANRDPQTATRLWRQLIDTPRDSDAEAPRFDSVLAVAALWRWLQVLDAADAVAADRVAEIIDIAEAGLSSRFMRALDGGGDIDLDLLPTLPQIEEASWRLLARLAWRAGREKQARRYFIEYLDLTTADAFDGIDREIMDSLLAIGLFSEERFGLFKTKRLIARKSFARAREYAARTYDTAHDPNIKAEAGLLLARHSRFEASNDENIALLGEVIEYAADPDLQYQALRLRATYHSRAAGSGPKTQRNEHRQAFIDDLELVIDLAPEGSVDAVEALFRLGNYFLATDFVRGLTYYSSLQALETEHHRMDSAYYIPAMRLIERAADGDTERATTLLKTLTRVRPEGPYTPAAHFWIARLAERRGEQDAARAGFAALAARYPFEYYGLRARMHLDSGEQAAGMLLPPQALLENLARVRREALHDERALPVNRYSRRLLAASRCGLYASVLTLDHELSRLWPDRRIETLSLADLDGAGVTPALVILLSLRLDSFAAAELAATANDVLALAALAGSHGDWTLQTRLADQARAMADVPVTREADGGFLVNAYPPAYASQVAASATRHDIPAALLSAIIRNESRYYRSALSVNEAIGLIQMRPGVFSDLQKKPAVNGQDCELGKLPRTREAAYEFLTNADDAIALGGCWIHNELLGPMKGNVVHAIMTHNAGAGTVRTWLRTWDARVMNDVELAIEQIPYAQTRTFTRRTLTDYILMTAYGEFD